MITNLYAHKINSRTFYTNQSVDQELQLEANSNYLFDLSYLSVLTVNGEKASEVLQGQLTCDMNLLSANTMLQGLQCNLQGRILTFMDVITWNGIKLIIPDDLALQTVSSLQKAALLSRVSIQNNEEFSVLGLLVQDENKLSHIGLNKDPHGVMTTPGYCIYHLDQQFYMVIVTKQNREDFIASFKGKIKFAGSLTWHMLMLKQRQIDIYPESRGLFIPQRLGLHQTTLISFNKGCYKGQEIIARLHYKSTAKHELQLFNVETNNSIFSGQKLFGIEHHAEVGEVVDYSFLGDGKYIIAISILKNAGKRVLLEGYTEAVDLLEVV